MLNFKSLVFFVTMHPKKQSDTRSNKRKTRRNSLTTCILKLLSKVFDEKNTFNIAAHYAETATSSCRRKEQNKACSWTKYVLSFSISIFLRVSTCKKREIHTCYQIYNMQSKCAVLRKQPIKKGTASTSTCFRELCLTRLH